MSSDWPVPGYRYVAPFEQGRAIHHAETVPGAPVVVKVFTEPGDDRAAAYVGLSGEAGWPGILASGTLPTGATFVIMPRFEPAPLRYGAPDSARRAVRQLAAAVDALHRRGRVHGDIRAGNVMATGDGSSQLALVGLTHGRGDQAGDVRALAELARTALANAGETPEVLASVAAARSAADVFSAAGPTGAGGGDTTTMVVADDRRGGGFAAPDDTVVVSEDLFDAFTRGDTIGVPDVFVAAPALDQTVVVADVLFEGGDTVVVDEDLFLDDDTVVVSEDLFDPAPAGPVSPTVRSDEDVTVDGVGHRPHGTPGLGDAQGAVPEGWLRPAPAPMSPFPGTPPGRAPLPAAPMPAAPVRSFQAPPAPLGEGSASGDLVSRVASAGSAMQFPVWLLALCALGLVAAIAAVVLAVTA